MAATHEAGDDCKRAHSSRHFLTERTVKGLPMQVKHVRVLMQVVPANGQSGDIRDLDV